MEALAIWEATALKSKRMSITSSTTTPTIILNRIKDGTNKIKGGISNKDRTTQVITPINTKVIISTNNFIIGSYLSRHIINNFILINNHLSQRWLPLREMIVNQNKVIDNMSRKIASNDKIIESINNRMDSFTSAIKNQLSFNKMIESQIS